MFRVKNEYSDFCGREKGQIGSDSGAGESSQACAHSLCQNLPTNCPKLP